MVGVARPKAGGLVKYLVLCLAAILPLALTTACGQKGALYLPPRNGTVVTRPGASGSPPTSTPQTTNQSTSPQDSTTLPSTTSESTPSGALKQDAGPATQATTPGSAGNKNDKDSTQTPPK